MEELLKKHQSKESVPCAPDPAWLCVANIDSARLLSTKSASSMFTLCLRHCGQPASDSWTAVGTILDHETLNIVCREELLGLSEITEK